eukprot:CAMPEP_0201585030 /NCGR_PEP_ID=MMETSP0190_2-20130828/117515_1 /ASSEMBLY_ACC=CAM_ASM_000263 /TAXON_ID=37353 /ORGANISM="Rosalina sp." /LENGTH=219 /DNA_ID=CAMNT_0048030193 /DNA_START=35 /DNA_END=690 /DNA_ORIENTATION=-
MASSVFDIGFFIFLSTITNIGAQFTGFAGQFANTGGQYNTANFGEPQQFHKFGGQYNTANFGEPQYRNIGGPQFPNLEGQYSNTGGQYSDINGQYSNTGGQYNTANFRRPQQSQIPYQQYNQQLYQDQIPSQYQPQYQSQERYNQQTPFGGEYRNFDEPQRLPPYQPSYHPKPYHDEFSRTKQEYNQQEGNDKNDINDINSNNFGPHCAQGTVQVGGFG